jgi:lipopolysaccharide export system permease protein
VKTTATIARYLARHYLVSLMLIVGVLVAVGFVFDTLELLRRASKRPDVAPGIVLQMALLKLPDLTQQLLPFAVLFGAAFSFWRLSRNQELVMVRVSGLSVWQFVLPAVAVAIVIAIAKLGLVNPVAAVMHDRFERLESRLLEGRASRVDLAETGFWLRQSDALGTTVLHARGVNPRSFELENVLVVFFNRENVYTGRLDAGTAVLEGGAWVVRNAWSNRPAQEPLFVERVRLPTDLSRTQIEESFASPASISFFRMPQFIETLEDTGFPALGLRLHFQSLLASPLLYGGLVLIAAACALGPPRRHPGRLAGGVVAAGFALFFLQDMIETLGRSGAVPVAVAAWAPAALVLLAGIVALLTLEDG